jgi:hypothetical protein
MSADNVAVDVNVIRSITDISTEVISVLQTINEPIISAGAQGPQGIQGPIGAASVGTLSDVNISGLVDGGLLVYSTQLGLWEVTKTLQKQTLECGQY